MAMTSSNRPVKKKAVSGSIDPRWPKPKVVRWLEIGAIPTIVGLWVPDWLGAYAHGSAPYIPPLLPPFPPLLVYVGAVILIVGCYQGVKGMGSAFRGVVVSGGLGVTFAVASVAAQLFGQSYLALLLTGLAAVFATGALWFTIGKVADITQETRTRFTWWAIAVLTVLTAVVYLGGLYLFAMGIAIGFTVLRLGVVLLTITFGFCRYGVHCYKTQTSIGAGFSSAPDEQYWAAPNYETQQ
jgi:hypothetical protein